MRARRPSSGERRQSFGYKCVPAQDLFHHRVPAVLYEDILPLVHPRPPVAPVGGKLREREQHIELGHGLRGGLHGRQPLFQRFPERKEELLFPRVPLVLRAQHAGLVFLQLLRDVPFGVRQRLLPDVVFGDLFQVRAGHFDVIPENAVVPDLQPTDPRPLPLARLHFGQHFLPVGKEVPQLVHPGIVPGPEDAAFLVPDGKRIGQRPGDPLHGLRMIAQPFAHPLQQP